MNPDWQVKLRGFGAEVGVGLNLILLKVLGDAELYGHPHKVCKRSGCHLSHDLTAMNGYSHFFNTKNICCLLVEQASRNEREHLSLAPCETREAGLEIRHGCAFLTQSPIARESTLDGRYQDVFV